MTSKLKIAKFIIKNEGFIALIKKIFYSYIFFYLYLCILFIKIKNSKFKNLTKLTNFVFNDCFGYLRPRQIKSEIISLLKTVKGLKPQTIMEIGTAKGGTLFLFSRAAQKNSLIISLDLPGGRFGEGYSLARIPVYKSFAKNKQTIALIRDDSHNLKTFQKIKEVLGNRKLDFLFIDGDHTYDGTKKDFQLYGRLVRKGGLIAFHDIVPHLLDKECRVNKFWNEIKKRYKHKEFIENQKQNWAGIGLIRV
jgi:predicted O-methyltransferase YrrM